MRKIKLIIAAAGMLALVSSSAVYADGFASGEGLYLGGFAGVGMGMVQPKVSTSGGSAPSSSANTSTSGIFEAKEGGIGLEGMEGGVWLGYGYKMGDLYAGIEGEYAPGDVEFELTSSVAVEINDGSSDQGDATGGTVSSIKAKKEFSGGMFGRVGYYVNPDTLLAFKAGVLVSKFDIDYGTLNESYYGGGPAFGLSLQSRLAVIDPNLSVRMETVYTDFLTVNANGGIGTITDTNETHSEVTGSALSARVGLQYSFFDVNSLF